MLSFPNTTNQGGKFNDLYDDHGNRIYQTDEQLSQFDVSRIKSFNMNLNSTIKKKLLDDASLDISVNSFRIKPKTILSKNFTIFTGEPYETVDTSGRSSKTAASQDNPVLASAENPFMIPASILSTVNRYNRIYKTPVNNLMNAGAENTEIPEGETQSTTESGSSEQTQSGNTSDQNTQQQQQTQTEEKPKKNIPDAIEVTGLKTKVVSSIFNPTHMIQVNGLLDNVPLMNMRANEQDDWISIGDAYSILGKTWKYDKKSGSYGYFDTIIEKPKTFNSWELDIDPKTGRVTNKSFGGHNDWKYDSATGTLYRDKETKTVTTTTNKGKTKTTETKTTTREVYKEPVNEADFTKGLLGQEKTAENPNGTWERDKNGNINVKIQWDPFNSKNIDNSGNCTIRELVRMSHTPNGQLGMSKYKYADFLFCKNIGKVSNNHMITLRRFAHPVGDNIFRFSGKGYLNTQMPGYHGHQENAGMGTLITWFGTDDNKLEDILSYSVKSSWREFKSKIQEIESEEDNAAGGLIGMFANSFNPAYNSLVAKGMAGSNSLWNKMGSSIFGGVINKATSIVGGSNAGQGGTNANSMKKWQLMRMDADKNKIYTPQNTIQATHKYEGELTLAHEFTLNFSYRLRALDVMNPKTVMLDLIGNILEVTYNRGHFWGGSRRFIGPPRNASGIAKANAFIDRQWNKLEGFMMGFANGTLDWKGIMSSLSDAVNSAVQAIKGAAEAKGGWANLFMDGAKKLAGKFVSSGASRALLGQLKNQLGRPAVYAMDSLLDGSPVGLWHVTIGNPKNPIAAFGNLIMTSAKITHSGPLGFDDFPTELKVSCTLKHGRSRDLSEVARMYTKGAGAFYNALDKNKLSEFFTVSNTNEGREVEAEMLNANYARGLVEQLDSVDAKISALTQENKTLQDEIDKADNEKKELSKQKNQNDQEKTKNKTDKDNKKENKDDKKDTKKDTKKDDKKDDKKTPKTEDNKKTQTDGNDKKTDTTDTTDQQKKEDDIKKKEQEIKEKKEKIAKNNAELEKLRKSKTEAQTLLRGDLGKYVKEDYSSIYGTPEKLNNMRQTAKELYEDNAIKNANYYTRGHFIRDNWALRYETLGQDLDTEGRILIDENA